MLSLRPSWVARLRAGFRMLGLRVEGINPALPEIWSSDEDFAALHQEVEAHTLVGPERCFRLVQLARMAKLVPGDLAEVGVFRGGTARLLARTRPERELHLFDTFAGLPDRVSEHDRLRAGEFAASLATVRGFLADCPRVAFHQGQFPTTAAAVADRRFSLVHVDVDLYESARACLEFFWPRLSPGGMLVLDDYEHPRTPGIRVAVHEFAPGRPRPPLVTARYQCLLLRVAD